MNFRNENELFTWVIKAGANRLYYLNVKVDKNKQVYLVIKETKRIQEDGSKEVHRVMVFEKDFHKFIQGLIEVLKFLNDNGYTSRDLDIVKTASVFQTQAKEFLGTPPSEDFNSKGVLDKEDFSVDEFKL